MNGTPSSLPPEGSAVLNDRPVACQIREPTDPQGDRWHGEAVADEVSPRSGASVVFVSDGDSFAPAGSVPPYPGGVSRHLPIAVLRAAMGAI